MHARAGLALTTLTLPFSRECRALPQDSKRGQARQAPSRSSAAVKGGRVGKTQKAKKKKRKVARPGGLDDVEGPRFRRKKSETS